MVFYMIMSGFIMKIMNFIFENRIEKCLIFEIFLLIVFILFDERKMYM